MKISGLLVAVALIMSAALLAAGMVGPTFLQQMNAETIKNQAVDSCLQIAKGVDISGSLEKNGWSVQKSNINADVYADCMKKKGL